MDATTSPLLGGHENDSAVVLLPALQGLLQLAHSEDTDEQVQASGATSAAIYNVCTTNQW